MNQPRKYHWIISSQLVLCWVCYATAALGQSLNDELGRPDPVVQSVLDRVGETPKAWAKVGPLELLNSLMDLHDLGHPKLARQMLDQLAQRKLDSQTLGQLAHTMGTARLMRLGAMRELGSAAASLATAAIEAQDRQARDPQQLKLLAKQLNDHSATTRRQALLHLLEADADGIAFLIAQLADPQQQPAHAKLAAAVLSFGDVAFAPLLAALETDDRRLKRQVIELLGRLGKHEASYFLLAPALADRDQTVRETAHRALVRLTGKPPHAASATRVIERQMTRYLAGDYLAPGDHTGQVVFWHWNAARRQVEPVRLVRREAGLALAARLARDRHLMTPDNVAQRRQYFAILLEATARQTDNPAAAAEAKRLVTQAGVDEVARLFEFCQRQSYWRAASIAADLLGEIGSAGLLQSNSGRPLPLVQATQAPDRRLRFAATMAIGRLAPDRPFAGSSSYVEALESFARSGRRPRALVAHARIQAGQNVAALLKTLNYETEVASSGRRFFQLATRSANVDLMLIDTRINQPGIRELVYQLRRHPATTGAPIGLIAQADNLHRMERVAAEFPATVAILTPRDEQAIALDVGKILERVDRVELSEAERTSQARLAIEQIGQLAVSKISFYQWRTLSPAVEAALFEPGLSQAAINTLQHLGTASSQQALVRFIGQSAYPMADRQAAVAALAHSTTQHGILLTTSEILQQYDLYNASESADQQIQDLLSAILDAIEAPALAQQKIVPALP